MTASVFSGSALRQLEPIDEPLDTRVFETPAQEAQSREPDVLPPHGEDFAEPSRWGAAPGPDKTSGDTRRTARQPKVGDLVDEDQDRMTLHTNEAVLLFEGRLRDPRSGLSAITGGRRAAAAARSVWLMSGDDNPYADWALLAISASLDSAREAIERTIVEQHEQVKAAKALGLLLTVQRSSRPAELEVGFRSPYGYAIAELVVRFDYLVRVVKSLVRKDRLSEDAGKQLIGGVRRGCRAAFEVAVRFDRHLGRVELSRLSRSDFLPGAPPPVRERARAAVRLLGVVPREVFVGEMRPRHTRRRVRPTPEELRLLSELDLSAGTEAGAPQPEPAAL